MSLKRRPAFRTPKPTFYIFCEGENTEPEYFRSLKKMQANLLIEVKGAVGVPYTVATEATTLCQKLGLGKKKKKNMPPRC